MEELVNLFVSKSSFYKDYALFHAVQPDSPLEKWLKSDPSQKVNFWKTFKGKYTFTDLRKYLEADGKGKGGASGKGKRKAAGSVSETEKKKAVAKKKKGKQVKESSEDEESS